MIDNLTYKYLIIGNSAGGIGAAEAIRTVDPKGSLAIVSDESGPAYSRPMIPHHLTEGMTLNDMLYRPSNFYTEKKIDTVLGKKVVQLQLSENKVILEDGEAIAYEKLLIATGGKPFIPRIGGIEKKSIYTFNTIKDVEEIRRKIEQQKPREAVVLGGGLIGLLAAEALNSIGLKVTVVELFERILGPILDTTASSMVMKMFERNSVNIITGHTISEILGEDEVHGILLNDGRRLPCDILIIAVGVTPRVDLARESGLKVNRGIVVNSRMETSIPNVYACGDCAELYDLASNSFHPIPIWPTAYVSGMVAGSNMVGMPREYDGGTVMNSMVLFGLSIISFGKVNPTKDDKCEVLFKIDEERKTYRKIVLSENRIVGAILAGEIDRAGIILGLMTKKIDVSGFKKALLQEDLGLITLPKVLRNRMLEVPVENVTH